MAHRESTAVPIALLAGILGAIQPKINAVLGARIGSVMVASVVNFAAALTVVIAGLMFRRGTRQRLAQIGSWPVPWWTLSAGLGGALIVVAGALAVDTIGVAIFSVAFFGGQITFGLFVDLLGIGPGGRRPVTAPRIQAAIAAIAAVAGSQLGRPVGEFAPALVALVVASGAALAFQSAFNGRIAATTGDAFAATAVNVVVGFIALLAIVAVLALRGDVTAVAWPTDLWLYTGGFLGVTVVVSMAVATRALGVLGATLALLAAQLIAAFAVDWMVDDVTPTLGVIAGSFLIVVAVALVQPRSRALAAAGS